MQINHLIKLQINQQQAYLASSIEKLIFYAANQDVKHHHSWV